MSKDRFKDKTVVVTGASAGVGRATALLFARHGARVGLIARGKEALEATRREIEAAGGSALVCVADVSDAQALDAAAERIERELGIIEVWVNNAMVTVFAPVAELEPEEFRRVTETTYLGGVYGTMAALKRMRPRNRGVIVQISSALAYRSIPLQSAYCGAKHALVGFLDSLRCELIHEKSRIHLTAVHMPALNTPQFEWARNKMPHRPQPVPPIYQPEVAARAVLFAATHRRREVSVGASTWFAFLGQRLSPALMDWYLGCTAFNGQQTEEPELNSQPDNLEMPVAGAHATRGTFSARAHWRSPALWIEMHRDSLLLGTLALGLAAAAACRQCRKHGHARFSCR
ncbi:MAG TPA: SDR family oxidoreductase [Rhodanobacteraceae bacterium]|nr:SDR family oxidoreductase [Rhodanobacteraceae bacterium]